MIFFFNAKTQQARIHRFLEKTKKKPKKGEELEETVDSEQLEKLRKKVNQLIKKQKVRQVRHIVKGHDESMPWGQENQLRVSCLFHLLIYRFHHAILESTSAYGNKLW
jgi:DNA-directed RNA polymerase, mitochondrial